MANRMLDWILEIIVSRELTFVLCHLSHDFWCVRSDRVRLNCGELEATVAYYC